MVTREDIKFTQQKLQFEAEMANAEDDYAARDLAAEYFPKVVAADVTDAQKVAELKKVIDYLKTFAADKMGEDLEKGKYWNGTEIAANNEGIINRLLENIVKLTPQGFDKELNELAQEISMNCNGGDRDRQSTNQTYKNLLRATYQKLRNKKTFRYPELAALFEKEIIWQKRQELDRISHDHSLPAEERLKAIDEKIAITTKTAYGNKHSNDLKANDCQQALDICRQELPYRQDKKEYYTMWRNHYSGNSKRANEYVVRRNRAARRTTPQRSFSM